MKTLLTTFVILTALNAHAQGHLRLTEGQSFTHSFSNLPFINSAQTAGALGAVDFYFAVANNDTQNVLRIEMFETSIAESPLISQTINQWRATSTTTPQDFSWGLRSNAAWQDTQGAFRITVLSGEAYLGGYRTWVIGGPVSPFSLHELTTPVPEPSTFALLGLCGVAWLGMRWKNRRKN
jgi:hypothetical protein